MSVPSAHRLRDGARRAQVLAVYSTLALTLALLFTGSAGAAVPDFLAKSPEEGLSGSGAGQMRDPSGVAANPNLPGNLYVADRVNHRISVFTPWGEFVRAFGWGVKDGGNEFQVCTSEAPGCQQGLTGGAAGQFNHPEAIAADSEGNVYVIEGENRRVQKFDSEGDFLLMFGREVNDTTKANVCTKANVEAGNVCGAGVAGTGLGWLGGGFAAYFNRLATNPLDNTIYVGEGEKIQAFNSNGTFKEVIEGGCLTGKSVRAITTDSAGNLYVAFNGSNEIRQLKGSGPAANCAVAPIFIAEAQPRILAPGPDGSLYAMVVGIGGEPQRVLEFDSSGACVNCGEKGEGGKPGFDRAESPDQITSLATGSACGPLDIYVGHFRAPNPSQSFINIWGVPPNVEDCPPPERAPQITAQYALSAEATEATVQALINPKFWPDTRYYLEYGTSPCSTGGCSSKQPLPPGSILTTKTTKAPLKSAAIVLEGLEPATTYFYRFVAESGGGGPVFGTGPEPSFAAGGEASFTTFAKPEIEPCPPNEAFRVGASALLPDCRAYELVSPLEKGSGDVVALPEFTTALPSTLDQSSTSGDKLSYGTYRSFGDAASAPFTTQYIAERGSDGWASHAISPPRGRLTLHAGQQIDTELKALSPDLCDSWWRTLAEPDTPMDPLAVPHYPNLYLRENEECGGGPDWEALTTVKPSNLPAIEYYNLELQGRTEDGSAAIYVAGDNLEGSGAPPQPTVCTEEAEGTDCVLRLYYRAAGEAVPTYACVLPNGTATNGCSAGTYGIDGGRARMSNLTGALSADGKRVFWSASLGPGPIFMREHPGAEETTEKDGEGDCVPDPELACTIAVSAEAEELSGTSSSRFWAADLEGERAIFTTGALQEGKADLYSFEVGTRTTTKIAGKVFGVAGTSSDAQRVYFVSEEACAPGATAGQRNLYLWEAGEDCAADEMSFVAELVAKDVDPVPVKDLSSAVAIQPRFRSTRVTPSGDVLAFMSQGSPTGYDNTDQKSGKADAEAYLYDSTANGGAGELVCASCNPSGARPVGFTPGLDFWIAAQIPVWENNLYAARALSEDGKRLYFESSDALTPRDTNGLLDVYQWEALGSWTCTEASSSYAPNNGGCVDLISSGQGSQAVRFNDASPDGSDVFFSTIESLLGPDYGLVDVYDARVGGGFPEPPPPPPGCEGETCRNPPAAPEHTTPSSLLSNGPGNLPQGKPKARRCPKGKRKVRRGAKARCVRKRKGDARKQKQKHTNKNRRTSR